MRYLFTLLLCVLTGSVAGAFQQGFTEMGQATGAGVAFSRGVSVTDFNNDGFDDIYITRKNRNNVLLQNKGDGTFEDIAESAGVDLIGDYNQSVWADYDQDGFPDFYLTTELGDQNLLFHNDGDGTFTDQTAVSGVGITDFTTAAIWGDVNGDGLKDLFVFLLMDDDRFFLNNGDGTFSDYTAESGITMARLSMGATFIDYDQDNDLDLYVAHDGHAGNFLFENDGSGRFADVSVNKNMLSDSEGMGVSVGDFNNDGWPDIYLTNRLQNFLFRNNQGQSFTEVSLTAGVGDEGMGWGVSWLDYDNDGWLDLYIGNDSDYSDHANVLYRNNGDETFSRQFESDGIAGDKGTYGTAIADFDHDGDLDLLLANRGTVDRSELFINNLENDHHWLVIRLADENDRVPVGAKVSVSAGEKTYTRYVLAGTSWSADDTKGLHFGLGVSTGFDKVSVTWPDGSVNEYDDIEADQAWLLKSDGQRETLTYEYTPLKITDQGGGNDIVTGIDEPEPNSLRLQTYPNPFVHDILVSFELSLAANVVIDLIAIKSNTQQNLHSKTLMPGQHHLYFQPEELSTGLYILAVSVAEKVYYRKLVKIE